MGATGSSLSGVTWFERYQDVQVRVTPNDGADDGAPVLSNILLEASDGTLRLSGTDLDISVSVEIEAEVETEGSVTVPARKFAEIARERAWSHLELRGLASSDRAG